MIVIGLDTVLGFELELSERPKSGTSYKPRPKSTQSCRTRPKSVFSDEQRSKIEDLSLRPDSRLSENEKTGCRVSASDSISGESLTGFKQTKNNLTGSNISESNLMLHSQLDATTQSEVCESLSNNDNVWLERKLNESVEKPVNETSRPVSRTSGCPRPDSRTSVCPRPDSRITVCPRPDSRLSVCERPESRLSDIFKREIKYTEKSRPKTGLANNKNVTCSNSRPKTCVPTSRKSATYGHKSSNSNRPKSGFLKVCLFKN